VQGRLQKAFHNFGMSFKEFIPTIDQKYIPKWDRALTKIQFNESQLNFLKSDFASVNVLIFACDFCPDCQNAIPIMHKMVEHSNFINLKIVDRDADKELFRNYLINNKALIPMFLFLNEEFHEVARWVERSTHGYKLMYESKIIAKAREDFIKNKNDKFKSNSETLFQENLDEIFSTLQRAVYMINTAAIKLS
jgi:thiol-disulfide isomerase/thioredoxin